MMRDLERQFKAIKEACGHLTADGNRGPWFSIVEVSDDKYIGCIEYDNHQFNEILRANHGHDWRTTFFELDHWPEFNFEYLFRYALKGKATKMFRDWSSNYLLKDNKKFLD